MPPRKRKAEIDTSEKPAKKMKQLKAAEVKEEEIKLEGDGKFNKQEIKIISWNLNGIRAVMKKDEFLRFVGRDEFDIICFNETKLQDSHIPEIRAKLPMYGYHYWTCSKTKKGYSGAAVLSKVQPVSVAYGIGKVKHDGEGRAVTAEFDTFYVVSTYIPNAGQVTSTQKLERLDYRTREWDVDFKAYLKDLERNKPVIWLGDLNVVHQDIDIYNMKGKEKIAGCTPQERRNFSELLQDGFKDTYRELHPTERKYSWYSAKNLRARPENMGWRLDYIVVSDSLMPRVIESTIYDDVMGSDHHPVSLILRNSG